MIFFHTTMGSRNAVRYSGFFCISVRCGIDIAIIGTDSYALEFRARASLPCRIKCFKKNFQKMLGLDERFRKNSGNI